MLEKAEHCAMQAQNTAGCACNEVTVYPDEATWQNGLACYCNTDSHCSQVESNSQNSKVYRCPKIQSIITEVGEQGLVEDYKQLGNIAGGTMLEKAEQCAIQARDTAECTCGEISVYPEKPSVANRLTCMCQTGECGRVLPNSYGSIVYHYTQAQPTPHPTPPPTPTPTATTTTTTVVSLEGLEDSEKEEEIMDEQSGTHGCAKWCYSKKHAPKPWKGKRCNWFACSTCVECSA